MKRFNKATLIGFLLTFSIITSAQNRQLFLAYDTIRDIGNNQVVIVYSNHHQNSGLVVNNDISNVIYHGRIIDAEKNEYIIFSSYSESVGSTKYYLFDIETDKFYISDSFQEYELPVIFSFKRSTLSMNLISFDSSSCGKLSILLFKSEKLVNYDSDDLKDLKTYLKINL